MRSSLEYLESLRSSVLPALPPNTFLKLDRGDGLMITNAATDTVIPGFTLIPRGSISVLYPTEETVSAFEESFEPAGELSRSVQRFNGIPASAQALRLFSEGLKLAQLPSTSRAQKYDKQVRQFIALSLRLNKTGGTYAIALLTDLLKNTTEVAP